MSGCNCPHVLTCEDLNLACVKFPGTEFWPVLFGEEAASPPVREEETAP